MSLAKRTPPQATAQACLLIYDGECQLCVSTKNKLEQAGVGRADSGIRFLPYQSEEAKRVLGKSYSHGRPDMAFLVQPSGEICRGLDAFLPLLPRLPGGPLVQWCLRFPVAKSLAIWGYRIIARYRYHLFGEAPSVRSQG
jgi:predicted DCC family thiol-disulfide oxidoreductase YuxK